LPAAETRKGFLSRLLGIFKREKKRANTAVIKKQTEAKE